MKKKYYNEKKYQPHIDFAWLGIYIYIHCCTVAREWRCDDSTLEVGLAGKGVGGKNKKFLFSVNKTKWMGVAT